MANSYFQFKKFIVHQEDCTMKVCTDSCIYGAALPLLNFNGKRITTVIDIGTGTGVLSLQYAQSNDVAQITAIEIDENAYHQATKNVQNSPYHNRIKVQLEDVNKMTTTEKVDLIICNPPFYENDVQSPSIAKNIAHHSTTLTMLQLFSKASEIIAQEGYFTLLLPTKRLGDILALCKQFNFTINSEITIHQDERKNDFRTIVYLTKIDSGILYKKVTLTIKENGNYSKAFIDLMQDYYIIF